MQWHRDTREKDGYDHVSINSVKILYKYRSLFGSTSVASLFLRVGTVTTDVSGLGAPITLGTLSAIPRQVAGTSTSVTSKVKT